MGINIKDVGRAFENHSPKPIGKHRYYSVLVPFVEKEGELYLLYEVRALHMKTQPGEVCFPGGAIEQGEGPMACAIRETSEELGIDPAKIEILGRGDILYGYANYTIFTYVGFIKYEDYCNLKLSVNEVDQVFIIPVSKLLEATPEIHYENVVAQIDDNFPYEKLGVDDKYPWRRTKWEIPIYEIDDRIIWGLTARITEAILGTIVCEMKK